MNLKFDKRTYHIQDGENTYEVVHVVKHPNPEYDDDSYFFYISKEDVEGNKYFWHFEPGKGLEIKLKNFIRLYEQT